MIYKGWTINVEYFSEIIHELRTQNIYSQIYDELVTVAPKTYLRDSKAVKRIATAYMKLLFPHWRNINDVNVEEFELFCLRPAIYRRGVIKEQLHNIDPEYNGIVTGISLK
jgi:ATP-dependent Lon protease